MTQPFSGFQTGGVIEPLSPTGVNTLLRDADPAVYFALDFFAYVITTYPGPRLLQASNAISLGLISAVAQKYPTLPQTEFKQNQFRFPLLCIGRTRTVTGRLTAGWERDRCYFDLVYALPPMDSAQIERVYPILTAVARDLRRKATQGSDPGYTPPGGAAGQSPWGAGFANVQDVGFGDPYRDLSEYVSFGFLEGTGNMYFPCIKMAGYFSERDMYNSAAEGAVKFAGGDITVDLQSPDGGAIDPFIQASTQQAPTVTSLSVVTGTAAGGTTTVITGTGFLKGITVRFGTVYATSVTWSSATSLTVVTPAMQGPGAYAVPVTVTNPPYDGQNGVLPLAFTFT